MSEGRRYEKQTIVLKYTADWSEVQRTALLGTLEGGVLLIAKPVWCVDVAQYGYRTLGTHFTECIQALKLLSTFPIS